MWRWLALVGVVAACAGTPLGPARFKNEEPAWKVDDRRDVPVPPRARPYLRYFYHFDSYYLRATRGLSLARPRRALAINALDEVPSSTWFTNRIGRHDLTPDEILRGPGPESPELHLPWTILRSKSGGTVPGFVVEDRRGTRFILKLDRPDVPEMQSGAGAIVSRLLWAAGYNVPSDHVVYFRRGDLRIDANATVLVDTKRRPLDDVLLSARLGAANAGDRYRGLASIYLPGKPLGGTPRLGVRDDDPNDLVPHEHRRDQRGQAPFMAWLASTDIKEDNTLDSWQPDPKQPAIHYLVHYLLDFGDALGADVAVTGHLHLGYRFEIDPAASLGSILSLGLYREPWEQRAPSILRGIGAYSDVHYDPGSWKPSTPAQLPVIWADRFDQFWGAKILIRFTRAHLTAAVAAARFTDPRATAYMIDTLERRQRRTARHWFQRVAPIDEITVDGSRLCFVDLARRHALLPAAAHYTATAYDKTGRAISGPAIVQPTASGRTCTALVLAPGLDRYTIVKLEAPRQPATLVHLAVEASSAPRVIGLYRL
jgi:hypothetical protein